MNSADVAKLGPTREDEVVERFQRGTLVEARCNHVFLEAVITESFLDARREHLARVACSVEALEQSPDLASFLEVLQWHDVNRLPHVAVKERHRHVEHHDDHLHVHFHSALPLRLVTRCPAQDESHEFQRWCRCKRVGSHLAGVDLCSTKVWIVPRRLPGLCVSRPTWTKSSCRE